MERFRLGINYWPRSSAMQMWHRFDAGEIDEDFARIAGLGLEGVRFFLLWSDFQPERDRIDRRALEHFDTILALCVKHRLRAMPTLFCGHMSGVNWLPAWTLDPTTSTLRFRTITADGVARHGIGDFYADAGLLEAQLRFARAVAERARDHPEFIAWDLGNEFTNLREPRTEAQAANWSAILAEELRELSGHAVTAGTHGEDLTTDRRLRLSSLCETLELATMHGYPVYSEFARGRMDDEVVPFLMHLTFAFAKKPVFFTEFGNPTCPPGVAPEDSPFASACLTEREMVHYGRSVLDHLQARGASGAMWWCWADYDAALRTQPPFDRAPHELHFGIIRDDGSEKPVARMLAEFAALQRETVALQAPAFSPEEAAYYAGLPATLTGSFRTYCARMEAA